ncbi:glycosidase [Microbacterium horticulturae]|uniref:Glycosidase n=1 Tax=Microbacterium horticulturae TaxID=3028316 RepID=A0ABY8C024_9MICO|nr:glycosidase [Microbacterium sp. KACC 23027]WEG09794.1 glycosidase [Microbacterium sp. KACC 23027]
MRDPHIVTSTPLIPYTLERLGVLMSPDADNVLEQEGVLNPATAWGADGSLYLYPRLVAAGNVSRVGRARVLVDDGVPRDVERLGSVLEADRGWEHGVAHGGVEDPRITWIPSLDRHVMTYVAFGPLGPRPAVAISRDGEQWTRLGPLQFAYDDTLDTDLNLFPNKDVVFFPEPVPGPGGALSYALLHRPMWDFSFVRPDEAPPLPAGITDDRASVWISYIPVEDVERDLSALARPTGHRMVAGPRFDWEALKIGAGPAPIRVPEGWLVLHHGVTGEVVGGAFVPQQNVRYVVGALLLDAADPSRVLARTETPLMEPETGDETAGTVANVVFPTAVERIDGRTFVFYGMADSKIGVAELHRGSSLSAT